MSTCFYLIILCYHFFNNYGFTQLSLRPYFVNQPLLIKSCHTLDSAGVSDHKIVAFDYELPASTRRQKFVTVRDFSSFDETVFLEDLRSMHLDNIFFMSSINQKEKLVLSNLEKEVDKLRLRISELESLQEKTDDKYLTEHLEMQKIVEALTEENISRQKQVEREKKQLKDFEDEVIETERRYIEDFKRQKDTIIQQNMEISNIKEINETLQITTLNYIEEIKKLKMDIDELMELNNNMVQTIRLLEEESKVLRDNIDTSVNNKHNRANKTSQCGENHIMKISSSPNGFTRNGYIEANVDSRKKVLIVGDELARGYSSKLSKQISDKEFVVEGIVKPNIELCDLTKQLYSNIMCHGQKDYLIVMFKTKSISNYSTLNNLLRNTLALGKITNLLTLCKASTPNDKILVSYIYSAISKFKHFNHNSSISFTHIDYTQSVEKCIKEFLMKSGNICERTVLRTIIPTTLLTHGHQTNSEDFPDAAGDQIIM
nr:unnamed protein product [Callosobruchus analis]